MILDRVEDKNPKDINGITPLHLAAKFGRADLFKAILDEVEDKNPKDKNGETPLHLATFNGHSQIAKMILDRSFLKNILI